MTDVESQENQGLGTSDRKRGMDHHGTDRWKSVQRGFGALKQNQSEHYSSLSNMDGFEDFEEFVLDFDDYDLLESIHTQLGSPIEPMRKFLWGVHTRSLSVAFSFNEGLLDSNECYIKLLTWSHMETLMVA